tara:strand:- start:111 stop:659 length:549 start_codon:yes stop_codon:yes gene_type:complete
MGVCSSRRNAVPPPTPPKKYCNDKKSDNDIEETTFNESCDVKQLWNQTKPFVPPVNKGRVIKVYDGDTITIASKIPGLRNSPLYRFSVRLNGIDTPELKGGKNEQEKEVAILARDWLSSQILNKDIELREVQTEKYGRLLAEVWFNKKNMNQEMIKKRFAVTYDGGTKNSPDNWVTYHNNRV